MTQTTVWIRWLIRRDLAEVLEITSQTPLVWSEEDFLRALRQRNIIGMIAEHGEKVVAFMVYELHKSRLEVLNLGVHQQWRRQGVGSQMIAKLVSKLSSHCRTWIDFRVGETNLPFLLFLKSQGFLAEGIDRGDEDVIRMAYRFDDAEPETVNRIWEFENN